MAMKGDDLATAIREAMALESPTPVNTYQERLFVRLATAIVKYLQDHADVSGVVSDVAGVMLGSGIVTKGASQSGTGKLE